jgi:hypothetical protein
MKKIMMTLAAVLCCTMTTVLTSCGDDDKESEKTKKDQTPAYVQMTFTFKATEDMLEYCDITVKYNDGTGEKTESMTSTEWKKTVKAALPATISFSKTTTLKAGKDATTTDKIAYNRGYGYRYDILNAQSEDLNISGSYASNPSSFIKGSLFPDAVNEGTFDKTFSYSFNENGEMVE